MLGSVFAAPAFVQVNEVEIPVGDAHVEPVPGLGEDHVGGRVHVPGVDDYLGCRVPGDTVRT